MERQTIKRKDLKVGDIVMYDSGFIVQISTIGSNIYCDRYLHKKEFSKFGGNCNSAEYKSVTGEERQHLLACIKANEYVPKEKIICDNILIFN